MRAFQLVVIDGPNRGGELLVDGSQPSRVLVGKGPMCALRLDDPEVSRRHVAFDTTASGLHLVDLVSTNGTFANGMLVRDVVLGGGEIIRLGRTTLRVELARASAPVHLRRSARFGRVLGASVAMRRLYPLCEKLAASDVPVIIEGETGTGKEVLAEALHEASPRAAGPFVVLDCTVIAPTLIESMLFGHERGAFTGASASRKGAFEQAHGGTLFIDEIGDLELPLQPKLLRAIERGVVQSVGSDVGRKVDVRIVAATRRDLDQEVQAGRFRDDLLFRLGMARIELPPLREREGDVPLLGRHFWHVLGGDDDAFPEDLPARFAEHPWPGNVRELHNLIATRLALGETIDLLGRNPLDGGSPPPPTGDDLVSSVLELDLPFPRARQKVIEQFERRYVERVLSQHGGDIAKAVTASGIGRRYFNMLRARQGR
jgi:DNA-binding NtrC family response regulator